MIISEIQFLHIIIVLQFLFIVRQAFLLRKCNKEKVSSPLFFKASFKNKRGKNMALVYGLTCGTPVDPDVVERRLTVTVNGEVVSTNSYDASTVDFGELSFAQDDNVVLSLVDVDDVGNVSSPSVLEFLATDTLPPAVPGGFTVSLLREDVDPTPVVEPVDPVEDPTEE
jgi:hypothetical protein